ncbi:MAG TPA: capsule assembly Wzi family protein [Terracidiphilus sp.]|jgi:hypothetical protein|nr:capsule assembly Wzi family protein [Terracidiphilus sp.]
MRFLPFLVAVLLIRGGAGPGARAQSAARHAASADAFPASMAGDSGAAGSVYVPVDSWMYAALDRLHALGYVDTAYLGLRPWTRLSIAHMLEQSADDMRADSGNDEARTIYFALLRAVEPDRRHAASGGAYAALESVYEELRGMSGTPLRDSFHLGQSVVNDYGRPYGNGFNDYSGLSARAGAGRLSLYVRGEVEHAPAAPGYSPALAEFLSDTVDGIPFAANPVQDTVPEGPIAAAGAVRVMEANVSYHLLNHEISFGKSDHWMGPGKGASMLWSNNAEDIYAFEIDRVEPLRIPGLSWLTGPFRYDFFVGSLKGHTYPNDPWVHVEKISFKPTRDLELGFDRMVIWGGKGHEPITLRTFLRSFFSVQNVPVAVKDSRRDPGARFGTFDFSYRIPGLRRWITVYTDSLVHDDVSPISAPQRSGIRPGIYLARFPHCEHLDLRAEAASTDTPVSSAQSGQFLYWEGVQRQGPTNKGFLVGDWVGRQGKGGQAWLTYHLSPREEVQIEYRNAKAASAFIPGGTTQNDFAAEVRKRVMETIEIYGRVQYERWRAPLYMPGMQSDARAEVRITWFPRE